VFRVSKADEPSRTIITIDGQLAGESVKVVEICCEKAISKGKPVHFFLRDVLTVDQGGRALLCRLAAKGVHLLGNGVYTAYLVRTLDPAGGEALISSIAAPPGGEA
jgi:hypothetical protein